MVSDFDVVIVDSNISPDDLSPRQQNSLALRL